MTETKVKKEKRISFFQRLKRDQVNGAKQAVMQDLFDDMYDNRWQVYKVNFIRGLFFGLGSVLGATLLLALFVWLLAQLGTLVPFLSDFIQDILDALNNRGK